MGANKLRLFFEPGSVAIVGASASPSKLGHGILRIFGKTRMGQIAKLQRFEALLAEHVDLDRLYHVLGLEAGPRPARSPSGEQSLDRKDKR